MSQRRWYLRRLGVNYYQAIVRGLLGKETWSLYAHILPSLRRCTFCCEILNPLKLVRIEGRRYVSEYGLAFLETAWDMGHIIHLCFHLHLIKPTKAERTLREKQSWNTWCSGSAVVTGRRQQHQRTRLQR